jgi:hypothetical protein
VAFEVEPIGERPGNKAQSVGEGAALDGQVREVGDGDET